MVQINFAKREINCKLVFYGPGLSGKTTNLEVVHKKAPASKKGELTSIATEGDRTLFFDYMPLELGKVGGMNTKFQLYTVPGQVYYNATRKLVLQGADGVVFVADSQPDKMDENLESFQNLEENLREQGLDPKTIPMVLQWNKRDLPNVATVEDLDRIVNKYNSPTFEAVAVTGEGVFPTLKKLAQMVLEKLNKEYGLQSDPGKGGGGPQKPPPQKQPTPPPPQQQRPTPPPQREPAPQVEAAPPPRREREREPEPEPVAASPLPSRNDGPAAGGGAGGASGGVRQWNVSGTKPTPPAGGGGGSKIALFVLLLVLVVVGGFAGGGFTGKLPPQLQQVYNQHLSPHIGGGSAASGESKTGEVKSGEAKSGSTKSDAAKSESGQ
jgi:mutual gliding-motility protein MglA